jgi:hypothetical protein
MSRHPPAVEYPVGPRARWVVAGTLGLPVAWALGLLLWARALDGQSWPGAWWFSLAVGLVLLAWSHWRARHPLIGTLVWAPEAGWHWRSAAYRHGTPLSALHPVLDLQSVVLVQAHTRAGLVLWLWLVREADPPVWDAVRRALQVRWPEVGRALRG